jgi:hypothetical protein
VNATAPLPNAVEALVLELERAAFLLPRASVEESEALLADLTTRVIAVGRATAVPKELAQRARNALGALSGSVAILKARNDARLDALLHASRPAAGYDDRGQFSRPFASSVSGCA